ncbi:hypothetical protein [Flavobacterium alkalisoli]|uniref:hypothetical protein n=1 Tax=Flavobacterium alkalisoli TaxID=2602769 RepID=UPI003A92AB09
MKAHLLLIVAILCISCNQKTEKEYYSHEVTDKLSKSLLDEILVKKSRDGYLPPPPSFYKEIYVKVKGDSICRIDIKNIYYTYVSLHKDTDKSFESFLYDAMNQNTEFESGLYFYPEKCFKPTDSITEYYNNNSFDSFLNKYCEKVDDNVYHFKKEQKKNMPTISYYLYLNRYKADQDCVSGIYIVNKL